VEDKKIQNQEGGSGESFPPSELTSPDILIKRKMLTIIVLFASSSSHVKIFSRKAKGALI
jgi:hypothetical protein